MMIEPNISGIFKSFNSRDDDEIVGGVRVLGLAENGNPVLHFKPNNQLLTVAASKKELSILGAWRLKLLGPKREKIDGAMVITGWDPDAAFAALRDAGEERGLFSPSNARGTGLWKTKDGVHYHNGKGCYSVDNVIYTPDQIVGVQPLENGTEADGKELFKLIEKSWGRQQGVRVLGWMVTAFAAGALDWRPHVWLTARHGSGKSTLLNNVVKVVLGTNQVTSANASAASLRGTVNQAAVAILLDEVEADGLDPQVQKRIGGLLEIARQSSSGSVALRGTAAGGAISRTMSSSFLFSSINPPVGTAADSSRILPINLTEIVQGSAKPVLDEARLGEIGRLILGRLINDWAGFQSQIQIAREELKKAGRDAREGDTVGTLVGAARWVTGMPGLAIEGNDLRERFDGRDDGRELLNRILQIPVAIHGNIAMAAGIDIAAMNRKSDQDQRAGRTAAEACGVVMSKKDGRDYVVIQCTHDSIKRNLNRDGWASVLLRIEGAFSGRASFGGVQARCTFVPIEAADDADTDPIADAPLATVEELLNLDMLMEGTA